MTRGSSRETTKARFADVDALARSEFGGAPLPLVGVQSGDIEDTRAHPFGDIEDTCPNQMADKGGLDALAGAIDHGAA